MQSLVRLVPPQRVDCKAPLWEYRREVSFPKHTAINFPVQKLRVNNLAIANLCSYPMKCNASCWDDSAKCLSQERNSALCTVWALNQQLSTLRSNRLSYAAAKQRSSKIASFSCAAASKQTEN